MSGDQFKPLNSKAELQSKLNDAGIPGGAHLTKIVSIPKVSGYLIEVGVVQHIARLRAELQSDLFSKSRGL
jgi:hypothetical protein